LGSTPQPLRKRHCCRNSRRSSATGLPLPSLEDNVAIADQALRKERAKYRHRQPNRPRTVRRLPSLLHVQTSPIPRRTGSRRWNGATSITPGRLTGSTLSLTPCGEREDMMPSWPGEYRYDPSDRCGYATRFKQFPMVCACTTQTAALTRPFMSVATTSANAAAAIHGCLGRICTGCGNTLKRSRPSRPTSRLAQHRRAGHPCGSPTGTRRTPTRAMDQLREAA